MKFIGERLPLKGSLERQGETRFKSVPRIVLVQGHEVMREGLEILLQKHGEFEVIGSFDNIEEILSRVEGEQHK